VINQILSSSEEIQDCFLLDYDDPNLSFIIAVSTALCHNLFVLETDE